MSCSPAHNGPSTVPAVPKRLQTESWVVQSDSREMFEQLLAEALTEDTRWQVVGFTTSAAWPYTYFALLVREVREE